MIRFWLFLHLLGFTLWLGGGFAAMVGSIMAKKEPRSALGVIVRAQTALYRMIIGPGALLTVLSGIVLTFVTGAASELAGYNPWLSAMQGAGLLGALLVLLIALPTAAKLSRVDPAGPTGAYFDELRQRLRVVSSIAGVLGLVALIAGAFVR